MSVKVYQDRVREIGCVVCTEQDNYYDVGGVQLHHVESIRDGLSEWAVVPLCEYHHTGAGGVHGLGRRGFVARYKLTDIDLLAMVAKELNR
jgi:hypothetical protein